VSRRQVTEGATRIAGEGADGNLYGVTTLTSKPNGQAGYRKQVCETCPWRLDAEVGRFPAQAYRESAPTAHDASFSTFACHESGKEHLQTCAGFILANSFDNIGVRIAECRGDLDRRQIKRTVPLYRSYRAMAEANGVDPDDPVLAPCRAHHDPCCENEDRNINGGCNNCGDPCI
jgi:hypothetical protein